MRNCLLVGHLGVLNKFDGAPPVEGDGVEPEVGAAGDPGQVAVGKGRPRVEWISTTPSKRT